MPFKKGQVTNPKGKPPGTKAKKTLQWDALAESITGEQAEKFAAYMNKLWHSQDEKKQQIAADLFIKTVEYFKPKQARVETRLEGNLGVTSIRFEDAEDSKG